MFYGLIRMHDYVREPSVSVCAIGDINRDAVPFQVAPFQHGKWIEFSIRDLCLEGAEDASSQHESYELAAYFYNRFAQLSNHELAFFFVIGDESFEERPDAKLYQQCLGAPVEQEIDGRKEWKRIAANYNVFYVAKEYAVEASNQAIRKQWSETIGEERVLSVKSSKSCIDVILGALALTSGVRNLEGFLKDMEDRAQSEERIAEVRAALTGYALALADGKVKIVRGPAAQQG